MCITQLIKLFIYCYGGERVITKGNEVAQHIYCSKWYGIQNMQNQKLILFMLAKAQRNIGYTIGEFENLSMMVYAEVFQ